MTTAHILTAVLAVLLITGTFDVARLIVGAVRRPTWRRTAATALLTACWLLVCAYLADGQWQTFGGRLPYSDTTFALLIAGTCTAAAAYAVLMRRPRPAAAWLVAGITVLVLHLTGVLPAGRLLLLRHWADITGWLGRHWQVFLIPVTAYAFAYLVYLLHQHGPALLDGPGRVIGLRYAGPWVVYRHDRDAPAGRTYLAGPGPAGDYSDPYVWDPDPSRAEQHRWAFWPTLPVVWLNSHHGFQATPLAAARAVYAVSAGKPTPRQLAEMLGADEARIAGRAETER